MMATLSHKTMTFHQPQQCWGCEREMPAGTEMHVVVVEATGKPTNHTYWCPVCKLVLEGLPADAYCRGELKARYAAGWEDVKRALAANRGRPMEWKPMPRDPGAMKENPE